MSDEGKAQESSCEISQEGIQNLRKALKQWESAFYVVHQRKPDKDDIAKAPKDIKDKYHQYSNWKKRPSSGNVSVMKSPTLEVPGDVWGADLNKKNLKVDKADSETRKDVALSRTSLAKLGEKLSLNLNKTSLTDKFNQPKSKSICKPPEQKKEIQCDDLSASPKSQTIALSKGKVEGLSEKESDAGLSPDLNIQVTDEEFAIKGDIFKGAAKLFTAGKPSAVKKMPIPTRPRLSFITSKVLKQLDSTLVDQPEEQIEASFKPVEASKLIPSARGIAPEFTALGKKCMDEISTDKVHSSDTSSGMLSSEGRVDTTGSSKNKSLADGIKSHESFTANASLWSATRFSDQSDSPSCSHSLKAREKLTQANTKVLPKRKESEQVSEAISFMEAEDSWLENQIAEESRTKVRTAKPGVRKRTRIVSMSDDMKQDEPTSAESAIVRAKKQQVQPRCQETMTSADTEIPDVSLSGQSATNDMDPEENVPFQKTQNRKRNASSMNENFVCLNMKRKGYRRKGAGMTGGQLRRKQWKAKMASRSKSFGSNKCFKCGEEGHWANKCKGKAKAKSSWSSQPDDVAEKTPVDESEFPSLREAAMMSRGLKSATRTTGPTGPIGIDDDDITDLEASIVRECPEDAPPPESVLPLASVVEDMSGETRKALTVFGFTSFKPGQERSVERILQGQSTLVVLSTGGGKSLCYQLPAYLYARHMKALTLVISPLVSLMDDQISELPPGVKGACLHSGMTAAQREAVTSDLTEGKVHFLLISPEAIVTRSGGSRQGSFPEPDRLPPIAFACIDEAHCLSEWSHNFRPSYLRICKVLRQRYGVRCFLGLTATATRATCRDVVRHLGIEDPDSATVRGAALPDNLVLSVSRDANRDEALIELLKGDRFKSCESIIVYCSRREQTERVATLIRTSMQFTSDLGGSLEPPAKKPRGKKKVVPFDPRVWTCESYHAGLTSAKRRSVQKAFMSGRLRVVVATVAFGMGLDKANVRAVLHYSMAKSFEGYVQEVGRAGRDGGVAHCHAFLDPENKDVCELRRHTFSNSIDRITVKKLLSRVFQPCRCAAVYGDCEREKDENVVLGSSRQLPTGSDNPKRGAACEGHERALPIEETVKWLDVREEGIATLLCYLELHPEIWLQNSTNVYATCSIKCYGGPSQLQAVAKKCPPVAVAIARQRQAGKKFSDCSELEFNVVELSDSMGWDSGVVKRELKSLEWETGPGGFRKSGVLVELSDLAFHFRSRGDLSDQEMDAVTEFLSERSRRQERFELRQLDMLADALNSVSYKNYWMCSQQADVDRSDRLKKKLTEFFETEEWCTDDESTLEDQNQIDTSALLHLSGDIRQFIGTYGSEHTLTGRTIARIFHGIGSPNFPAETWGRVRRYWRSHLGLDFNVVLREATQILVSMR